VCGADPDLAAGLTELGARFWSWRAHHQPRGQDDVPRPERPAGWSPDWSREAIAQRRDELASFEAECRILDTCAAPVGLRVDHRLIMSALSRVRWEYDVLRSWQRDPGFYIDQSIGVAFDELLQPPPFTLRRRLALLRALAAVPSTLRAGRSNLAGHAVPLLAESAAARLAEIDDQVRETGDALAEVLDSGADPIRRAADIAASALAEYRDALPSLSGLEGAASGPAVGPAAFQYFLSRVALLPYTADELMTIGKLEYERAAALSAIAGARSGPTRTPATDAVAQRAGQAADETLVRSFYRTRQLLTLPSWLGRYRMAEMPPYLAPLSWLGVTDDLTSAGRPADDATSYAPAPAAELPFFHAANVADSRLGIIHEGCHYYQLALSWRNPDAVRRHYYDSAPCEGIAFYNEELLAEAGLFADNVAAHRLVRAFMQLRAIRLQVDAGLATGALTFREAEDMLTAAPLDAATARAEAAFFLACPGQGISYQAGKTQVLRLVAAARRCSGGRELREIHDYLWQNGNVPISLLRWELLGQRDELDRADSLAPSLDEVCRGLP
jgi:Bacterial protein of unknown function (DUF885)